MPVVPLFVGHYTRQALTDIEATRKTGHDVVKELQQVVESYKQGGAKTLISMNGPLKTGAITAYTSTSGKFVLLCFGSGFTASANAGIGVQLDVNGKAVAQARLFSNPANVHAAFVPTTYVNNGRPGEYNIGLLAAPGTFTDNNDHFEVLVIELP